MEHGLQGSRASVGTAPGLQSTDLIVVAHGTSSLRFVGSSLPRDPPCVSCTDRWILSYWATREAPSLSSLNIALNSGIKKVVFVLHILWIYILVFWMECPKCCSKWKLVCGLKAISYCRANLDIGFELRLTLFWKNSFLSSFRNLENSVMQMFAFIMTMVLALARGRKTQV